MLDSMRHKRYLSWGLASLVFTAAAGGAAELAGSEILRPDLVFSPGKALWILAAGTLAWAVIGLIPVLLAVVVLRLVVPDRSSPLLSAMCFLAPVGLALTAVALNRTLILMGSQQSAWVSAGVVSAVFVSGIVLWALASWLGSKAGTFKRVVYCAAALAVLGIFAVCLYSPPAAGIAGSAHHENSIVLVTLDTVRVDHLGIYGADKGLTPNLDRLAGESIVFDSAYCTQPETGPSHATILTGLDPLSHGLWKGNGYALSGSITTLPQMLQSADYSTAAFVSGYPLERVFGFNRGFGVYDDAFAGPLKTFITPFSMFTMLKAGLGSYELERDGADSLDAALMWLDRTDPPFFLWLHLYDPHHPYLDHTGRMTESEVEGVNQRWFDDELQAGDAEKIRTLYEREIAYTDAQVGRLIVELRRRNLLDRVVLAVVGDHGEGLGDHDYKWHSERLYEEQVRVPLIVRLPGAERGGIRIYTLARTTDIAPTLYNLALPNTFVPIVPDGVDLARSFDADSEELGETVLMLTRKGAIGGTDGQVKIIEDVISEQVQVFDLINDPGESESLVEPPAQSIDLVGNIDVFRDRMKRTMGLPESAEE